ncbi:dynamin family protein [Lentzea sp. NPDC059081]|uniref:dynamin family protein n=1 Tax=Lentzea sp. NPDC059081 TaxID=3346719 RepID=UPI0036ACAABF
MTDRPSYERLHDARTALTRAAERLREICADAGIDKFAADANALHGRLSNDALRIVVVGKKNRGKSALINAMLGNRVLPVRSRPYTAVETTVRWGPKPRCVVYPVSGPPEEVDVGRLAELTTIPLDRQDQWSSPYRTAEIYWPLELCRNGVEITDSPGLDDDDVREALARNALQLADAVVYVTALQDTFGQSDEKYAAQDLRALGHERPFIVFTGVDRIPPDERDESVAVALRRVSAALGTDAETFVIVPPDVLAMRERGEPDHDTAMLRFEKALEEFAVGHGGEVKVVRESHQAEQLAERLDKRLAGEQRLRLEDQAQLRERWEQQQVPLQLLEQHRDHVGSVVHTALESLRRLVEHLAERWLLAAADRCPEIIANATTESKIRLLPTKLKESAENLAEELQQVLTDHLDAEFVAWQRGPLQAEIDGWAAELGKRLDEDLHQFAEQAEQIRLDLVTTGDRVKVSGEDVSTAERLLAAAISTVIVGPAGAIDGARFGLRGSLRALAPQLGVMIGVIVLGGGPIAILAALVVTQLVRQWSINNKIEAKIREDLAARTEQAMRERAPKQAVQIAERVLGEVGRIRQVTSLLDTEIENLRGTVQVVLADHEAKEKDIRAREDTLSSARQRLVDVIDEIKAVRRTLGDQA